MQRNRFLVQADDRLGRIIRLFIDGQNLFYFLIYWLADECHDIVHRKMCHDIGHKLLRSVSG